MLNLKTLELENIVYYNHAKVDLNNNSGFVVVSGLNKDSRLSKDQNNGSGKSLLFGSIPNLRFASAPSSTAKNTKKEMLDSSKSSISLTYEDNQGREITLVQKPTKWQIFIDGEDQQFRTVASQQKEMEELFPLTEDEFYAYTFISSIQGQRQHFQTARPADRLKFITAVAHLDQYDYLKAYFTKRLGEVKEQQNRHEVLESKYHSTIKQLNDVDWSEDEKEKAEKTRQEFDEVQKERDIASEKLSKHRARMRSFKSYGKLVSELEELEESLSTNDPSAYKKKLNSLLRRIDEHSEYQRNLSTYKKNTARIRNRLEELYKDVPSESIKKLRKRVEKLKGERKSVNQELEEITSALDSYHSLVKEKDRAYKEMEKLGYSTDLDMDTGIDDSIDAYRTTLQLDKLLKKGGSVCPTCHQDVDLKKIKKSVKKAKSKLEELENLREARKYYLEYAQTEEQLSSMDKPKKSHKEKLEKRLDSIDREIEVSQNGIQTLERVQELEKNLDDIEVPKEPSSKKPNITRDYAESKIEECDNMLSTLRSIESMEDENPGLSEYRSDVYHAYDQMKEKASALKDRLAKVDKKYRKLMKAVNDYDLRKGQFDILEKQRKELEEEMRGSEDILSKREVFKSLERAYSSKGLKVRKANEVLGLIEANMNRYSSLIFAEPFKFSLYAKEQGVFCDVDRNNGKISDVRLMSGSESDAFRLLFMVSLLLIVPSYRRTNILVLDEPDTHMDDSTRGLFIDRFIPFLREIVPHTFLITPKDYHNYDAERIVIVKDNGVSEVKYGTDWSS